MSTGDALLILSSIPPYDDIWSFLFPSRGSSFGKIILAKFEGEEERKRRYQGAPPYWEGDCEMSLP